MTLTLPDLPDEVAARLRAQAARHGRTLEAEAVACLRDATAPSRPLAEVPAAESASPTRDVLAERDAERGAPGESTEAAALARIRARRARLDVHLTDAAIEAAIREGRP
jgi:plasmid stability protein